MHESFNLIVKTGSFFSVKNETDDNTVFPVWIVQHPQGRVKTFTSQEMKTLLEKDVRNISIIPRFVANYPEILPQVEEFFKDVLHYLKHLPPTGEIPETISSC